MSLTDSSSDLRNLIYYNDDLDDRGSEFEPVTYKLVSCNAGKKANLARPPKWVLLDHTIAVVWSLFNSFYNYQLDIDDLKWAHEFLKDVKNSKGETPPDVKACLEAIQDRMISLYAKLVPTRDAKEGERSCPPTAASTQPRIHFPGGQKEEEEEEEEEDDGAYVVEHTIFTRKKASGNDVAKAESDRQSVKESKSGESNRRSMLKDPVLGDLKKSLYGMAKRGSAPAPSAGSVAGKKPETSKKEEMTAMSENYLKDASERGASERLSSLCSSSNENLGKRKTSASLHSEQFSRDTSDAKDSFENSLSTGKISLQFRRSVTAEELNNEEQAYRNLKNEIRNLTKNPHTSKEQVFKFLSEWRDVQVERFQSELKRLYSIEEFLKCVKKDGFVPYLEKDLSQRLASLGKKNAKKTT